MFGFVMADKSALSQTQLARYRGCYCGLCAAIRRRHGALAGLTLTYDLTLVVLLLGAVYQPQCETQKSRCLIHPVCGTACWHSVYTDYAADMNVLLAYHKLLDDWRDEHALTHLAAAQPLAAAARRAAAQWPRQAQAVQDCLAHLAVVEADGLPAPDEAAHWFGVLLGELFWLQEDAFAPSLRAFGYHLGKFIYLMDASVDLRADLKHKRYNPLAFILQTDHRALLRQTLGRAVQHLEALPLARDKDLVENILFAGIWTRYELLQKKRGGKEAIGHV